MLALLKKALFWGLLLWAIGYILGIVLFMLVPLSLIGWIITPIGMFITYWVLRRKFASRTFREYFFIGLIWVIIAVVLDYFLLVQLFKPADGYYKLDVYLYYLLTFTLPMVMGWRRSTASS